MKSYLVIRAPKPSGLYNKVMFVYARTKAAAVREAMRNSAMQEDTRDGHRLKEYNLPQAYVVENGSFFYV